MARLGEAPERDEILGEIVAYLAVSKGADGVVTLVEDSVEDPRERIAVLTRATTVLASWCGK